MRFDRMMSLVRGRRTAVGLAAVLALVLSGAVVALVDAGGGGGKTARVADRLSRQSNPATTVPAGGAGAIGGSGAAVGPVQSSQPSAAMTARGASDGRSAAQDVAKGAPTLGTTDTPGAKVVKTANLRVRVGKGRFQSSFAEASAIANRHGGFVASSSQANATDEAAEGTLTIRVPADKFETARNELGALGTLENLEMGGQDVSAQIVDYDARIRNLQAQEQALSTLLSRARTIGEVLEVQGQLFNVRQQIEQLQAERANLDAQASMATITATVFEPGAAAARPPEEPATGLARSFERAWDGAIAVIGGVVVVVGYLVPLVLIALLAWAIFRLATRHRRPATPAPAA